MMAEWGGEPTRKADLGSLRLILLGLGVSMLSFAGFRAATDTRMEAPESADRTVLNASVGSSVPAMLFPRLVQSDRNLPKSNTSPISSPEPLPSPSQVSSLVSRPVGDAKPLAAVPEFREIEHRFSTGETFARVIGDYGVSPAKAAEWIRVANRAYPLAQVRAGQLLKMRVAVATSDILEMELGIDSTTSLVGKRRHGEVFAAREPVPVERVRRVLHGHITSSFYASAARAGIPDDVISEVAEVLGWDLDFRTIRAGAEFRIQFEELQRPDGTKVAGELLAVRIENAGKVHEGIRFQAPGEKNGSYYNSKGEALGRAYLRYPLSFTRISSVFSASRLHPVLKRARPHYGVDFAAPTGTPVRAVADGKVEIAGWHGGNGQYIEIRHDETYKSGYGHLSRISSGVRPGSTVRKGQVIGYVGSTGLATGPHLHFVMYRDGKYIDPLSTAAPRSMALSTESLRRFGDMVKKVEAAYAAAERAGGELVLASVATPGVTPR
jgi:murein DD-endopeptidase MepM/ murein hydrolase activator NlpD